MKLYQKFLLFTYFTTLFLFSLYSYALVDLNLTLFNHSLWTSFRNKIIQLGYFKKELSSFIYLSFILILFTFHFLFQKIKISAFKLSLIVFFATFFSYPFLSHDFFNYLFDSKILVAYHKNPYLHSALDFPNDPWLRFMHWVHRKYPYGPFFLLFSSLPLLFSFGKFFLSFFLSKIFYLFPFILSLFYLEKINKRAALFLATQPLIIIEGFINAHNDFVALSFALLGIYFLSNNKKVKGFLFFLFSALIKYISLPSLLLAFKEKKVIKQLSFLFIIILVLAVSLKGEIQPWYFLNLFIFAPFFLSFTKNFQIFFASLLLSYYPYVRFSEWSLKSSIELKHQIIIIGTVINLIFLCLKFSLKKLKN